jgi:hypothetical protein
MIARAPHANQAYANDSVEVWSYMANITRAHDCWTYVKPAQRTKYGRRAFCYGITSLDPTTLITWYQKQKLSLDRSVIMSKERSGPGKKYVQIHAEQYAVLNGLTDYGYSGIDNGTKVRKLMAGIKTDALDTVKSAVLASPALRTNYPDVVTLYGDFIKQQKIESASMNVSDVLW